MRAFLWNIFLAFTWSFAVGEFSAGNVAIGFALGYAVLWLGEKVVDSKGYTTHFRKLCEFIALFFWELVYANLRLAYEVMTPTHNMRPGIIAVPLDAKTDGEITLLANLIGLTPGTLTLDVSEDRKFLYVHSTYIGDPEAEKKHIKDLLERRLLELLR